MSKKNIGETMRKLRHDIKSFVSNCNAFEVCLDQVDNNYSNSFIVVDLAIDCFPATKNGNKSLSTRLDFK